MRRWLLGCVVALLLAGCSAATPVPAAPTGAPSGPDVSGIIVGLEGHATLRRATWREYVPANFGTVLRKGDLLRVDTEATVACDGFELNTVGSGLNGLPCKNAAAERIIFYGNTRAGAMRGRPGPLMVLSPRKTLLLDPHPVLRWNVLAGAESYQVSLQGTNWMTEVDGATTELVYPADAPALQEGMSYKLIVQAAGQTTEAESESGLGFTLMSRDEAAVVRQAEEHIRSLGLADPAARFLIANQYASHSLYAEAIEQLVAIRAPEPAVARLLGDLYLQVGLGGQAETAYRQALELSQAAAAQDLEDIEGQTLAHVGLSAAYTAQGKASDAESHRLAAIALYEKLGDAARVQELQEQAPESR